MSLTTICTAIAATLKEKVPGLKDARGPVGGRVDLAEIKRGVPATLPCALVVCTGTEDAVQQNDLVIMRAMFAAFIVLRGAAGPNGEREKAIADLAGRVVTRVVQETWGDDQVQKVPANVDSRNLYTGKLDANDAALWVVTWEQQIALGDEDPHPALDDFNSIAVDWQLHGSNPEIDAQDVIKPNG